MSSHQRWFQYIPVGYRLDLWRAEMRRRDFIAGLSGAVAWPLGTRAQQAKAKIGVLVGSDPTFFVNELRQGLRELGYVEGQTIQLEVRSGNGITAELVPIAVELVADKVDVIVAYPTPAASAAKQATKEVPIVIVAGDPIATGLIDSLARPGGNITGVSGVAAEVATKNLEMVREVLPFARRAAVLANANDPFHLPFLDTIQAAASTLQIEIKTLMVQTADELETDFEDIEKWRADAVLVQPSLPQKRIAELAAKYHLPALSPDPEFTGLGGLMSYSSDFKALFRRCAVFVDKILKGAKPADLPVEQPTKFWLVINLKTAKSLGLTIPETLLATADEVIQ
jgi:putative tryptophan/tyrosine transport system substrate-binding protein